MVVDASAMTLHTSLVGSSHAQPLVESASNQLLPEQPTKQVSLRVDQSQLQPGKSLYLIDEYRRCLNSFSLSNEPFAQGSGASDAASTAPNFQSSNFHRELGQQQLPGNQLTGPSQQQLNHLMQTAQNNYQGRLDSSETRSASVTINIPNNLQPLHGRTGTVFIS